MSESKLPTTPEAIANPDPRIQGIADLLECDVDDIEQAIRTLLYANAMLTIENGELESGS